MISSKVIIRRKPAIGQAHSALEASPQPARIRRNNISRSTNSFTGSAAPRRSYSNGPFNLRVASLYRAAIVLLVLACLAVGAVAGPDSHPRGDADLTIIRTARGPILAGATLARRTDTASASASASTTASDSTSTVPTGTARESATSLRTATGEAESTGMPVPFDRAALVSNITTDCSTFLLSAFRSRSFLDCHPFSFLLRNSISFFNLQKQGTYPLAAAFDTICAVDLDTCKQRFEDLAKEITVPHNCLEDYQKQNPIVEQAVQGLADFEVLYRAGCVKNEDGDWCYVTASQNILHQGDLALYDLARGVNAVPGTNLTCGECTRDTMRIFANVGVNASSPLARVYEPAAKAVNEACGENTVDEKIRLLENGARATRAAAPGAVLVTLLVLALGFLGF